MNKKLLITGVTGYLGGHLVRRFLDDGFDICAVIREESDTSHLNDLSSKIKFIKEEELDQMIPIDFFVHTATAYGRKGESEQQIYKTNVDFPKRILEKITHKKLIFINTDTSLPESLNIYSKSKRDFRNYLESSFKGSVAINIILEQFYGPKDKSFLGLVINSLKKNEPIELTDGTQKRDFIFIDDVVEAFPYVLKNRDKFPKGFSSVPLGSGRAYKIRDVVEKLANKLNADQTLLLWGRRERRPNEPEELLADISFLKHLGFEPKIDLDEGLKRLAGD